MESYYSKQLTYTNDSGFDLYCPNDIVIPPKAISFKIDLKVQTMFLVDNINVGYLMMPRSSMGSKTPLRLCNSIGLIDAGYRGNLIMVVDNISNNNVNITKGTRLVQAVSFNGKPIMGNIVNELKSSQRGEAGFGSTDK